MAWSFQKFPAKTKHLDCFSANWPEYLVRFLFGQVSGDGMCEESRRSPESWDLEGAQCLKVRVKMTPDFRKPVLLCKIMMTVVLMNDRNDITLSLVSHVLSLSQLWNRRAMTITLTEPGPSTGLASLTSQEQPFTTRDRLMNPNRWKL